MQVMTYDYYAVTLPHADAAPIRLYEAFDLEE
jgi:hypothetical protein